MTMDSREIKCNSFHREQMKKLFPKKKGGTFIISMMEFTGGAMQYTNAKMIHNFGFVHQYEMFVVDLDIYNLKCKKNTILRIHPTDLR